MACLKQLAIALGMVVLLGGANAQAAELGISKAPRVVERVGGHCQRIQQCHGDICEWKRVCWGGCPDRYSCAPLYGAYGPYGGRGYWAAYSYGDLRPF